MTSAIAKPKFEKVKSALVTRPTYHVLLKGKRIGYMFKDRATRLWVLRGPEGEWAQANTLAQAMGHWRYRVLEAQKVLGA